jgi:hypothetical protein
MCHKIYIVMFTWDVVFYLMCSILYCILSIRNAFGLFFQWTSCINVQLSVLVLYKADSKKSLKIPEG